MANNYISKFKLPGSETVYYIKVELANINGADDLKAIEALTGTGFLCRTADNTWTLSSISSGMQFKGTISSALPASHTAGDVYIVSAAGTYAGQTCEVGDMIICVTTGTTSTNSHWAVIQKNIDGAVTGPTSSTDGHIAVFNGATGKIIKDGGTPISVLTQASQPTTQNANDLWYEIIS